MADLRASTNGARRTRGVEEKKALAELAKGVEDFAGRLEKAAEASASSEASPAERLVADFHTLPLAAKLRVVGNQRAAWALFAAAFCLGAMAVLAILVEVYTAWDCGFRCTGASR